MVAPLCGEGFQPHMNVTVIRPSSRVTCPWHGIRNGPGRSHTLTSPLACTHDKCSSHTEPGQPGEAGSISKLDPRHAGRTSKETEGVQPAPWPPLQPLELGALLGPTFLTAHWKPVCLSSILCTSPKEPLPRQGWRVAQWTSSRYS